MASDQMVESRHILQAIVAVQRRGAWALIADLEKVEPELAEYLREMLSTLHQELAKTGTSHRRLRRIDKTAQELAVVCIAALRAAHFDLWRDDAAAPGSRLSRLQSPSSGDDEKPPPPPPLTGPASPS